MVLVAVVLVVEAVPVSITLIDAHPRHVATPAPARPAGRGAWCLLTVTVVDLAAIVARSTVRSRT